MRAFAMKKGSNPKNVLTILVLQVESKKTGIRQTYFFEYTALPKNY